jgi:CSLREA domain-containing protein
VVIRLRLLVPLIAVLCALVAPAWAAAAEFTVNATGDAAKGEPGVSCTVALSECTLRAAIQTANESSATADVIKFDPTVFNGEPTDTIAPGLLPAISTPTTVDGASCNVGSAIPCLTANGGNPLLVFSAGETKLENTLVSVPSGMVGIRVSGSKGAGSGVEILNNTISMPGNTLPSTGIEVQFGASGDLIEGNKITSVLGFNFSISIRGNSNRILGNELKGGGCCQAGISLELGASGNQIGGDTPPSENLIQGFASGAVLMSNSPNDSSHNEVRRNRGENGSNFISGASLAAPVITEALQSSATGTAEPEATVRLFRKTTEGAGEIASFLGEVKAGSDGKWKVTFAKVPTDTLAAATQTLTGKTSGLGETIHLAEEPETGGGGGGGGGGGDNGGGGTGDNGSGGSKDAGGGASSSSSGSNATPIAAPAPVAPKVKMTAGPKKSSTATTAKFRFKAEPATGAKFECRLDKSKWARCSSPLTYKGLKVGKHTFRVRATANGLTGAAAVFKFTTITE